MVFSSFFPAVCSRNQSRYCDAIDFCYTLWEKKKCDTIDHSLINRVTVTRLISATHCGKKKKRKPESMLVASDRVILYSPKSILMASIHFIPHTYIL
jgi:hypothetical protein